MKNKTIKEFVFQSC